MPTSLDRLQLALGSTYRIEREVGAGGMATVYLASDLKHGRQVALKVLRAELTAAMGTDRFPREIQIIAQLQHPHIVPLYDSGEAGGFLYYVMPFVDGESLRTRLASAGPMSVNEAVRLLREITDALTYAHARGIVHRDIKPDNVMLSGRHAAVTDFGVAKALRESAGDSLTTVGIAVGTPQYMAPEQATADANIDQRVDIYALGVLGYEMLTGKPLFDASTAQGQLMAHVLEAPKDIRERRAEVPALLAETLLRCVAKDPADRWQSADELLVQLDQIASTPSGGVTPTTTQPVKAAAKSAGKKATTPPAPLQRWIGTLQIVWERGNVLTLPPLGFTPRGDSLVIVPTLPDGGRGTFIISTRTGQGRRILGDNELGSDLTPDGTHLIYRFGSPKVDLGLYNLRDGTTRRLTNAKESQAQFWLSHDGKTLLATRSVSRQRIVTVDLRATLAKKR